MKTFYFESDVDGCNGLMAEFPSLDDAMDWYVNDCLRDQVFSFVRILEVVVDLRF